MGQFSRKLSHIYIPVCLWYETFWLLTVAGTSADALHVHVTGWWRRDGGGTVEEGWGGGGVVEE